MDKDFCHEARKYEGVTKKISAKEDETADARRTWMEETINLKKEGI